jgi:hypothetical protein
MIDLDNDTNIKIVISFFKSELYFKVPLLFLALHQQIVSIYSTAIED